MLSDLSVIVAFVGGSVGLSEVVVDGSVEISGSVVASTSSVSGGGVVVVMSVSEIGLINPASEKQMNSNQCKPTFTKSLLSCSEYQYNCLSNCKQQIFVFIYCICLPTCIHTFILYRLTH